MIHSKLGDFAISSDYGADVSVHEIWNLKKNILFISKQKKSPNTPPSLIWSASSLKSQWPKVGTPLRLQDKLKEYAEGYNPKTKQFWIPQIILTPAQSGTLSGNLKTMATIIDRGAMVYYVTRLSEQKSESTINVALVDYYGAEGDTTFDACMNINRSRMQ